MENETGSEVTLTEVETTTENTDETVENEVETESESTEEESKEVDWKARAEKAEKLAGNYKIRAEKAEKKSKEGKIETSNETGLSTKDVLILAKANIHEDDIDEVVEYAQFKKIPIAEAIKSGVMKTFIKEKEEKRRVAAATNTGSARRSSTKPSADDILDRASKGQLPEDPADLAKARWELRKKSSK